MIMQILFTAAVILIVLFGLRTLGRVRRGLAKGIEDAAAQMRGEAKRPASGSAMTETKKCGRCGAFVPVGHQPTCGQNDCPMAV